MQEPRFFDICRDARLRVSLFLKKFTKIYMLYLRADRSTAEVMEAFSVVNDTSAIESALISVVKDVFAVVTDVISEMHEAFAVVKDTISVAHETISVAHECSANETEWSATNHIKTDNMF